MLHHVFDVKLVGIDQTRKHMNIDIIVINSDKHWFYILDELKRQYPGHIFYQN